MDEDLKQAIQEWAPPSHSADFDGRMLAAYRQRMPWWTRVMRTRVAIPVPVLAAAVVVVLVSVWLAVSRQEPEEIRWRPVAEPKLRVVTAGDVR